MVKISINIVLLLIGLQVGAQGYKYAYRIEFTDKNNSVYAITQPEEFLSERAIERRNKWNIAITENDFPVNTAYTDSLALLNADLHVTSRWFNSAVYYTNNNDFESQVSAISFVKSTKLVYLNLNSLKTAATNSKFENSNDAIDYGNSTGQITMCEAQELHERDYRAQGIHIAVLDAGFWKVNELACFDSLFQNDRILGTWDFVSHNTNVYNDHTHGMSVLSIIAGNLPGQLVGSAPQASYYLYRTEDVNSEFPIEEDNWLMAAETADSAGADIITSSLGYSVFDYSPLDYTYQQMDGKTTRITQAAEMAFSKGMVIVNSAGNEGDNPWHYITAPSDGKHVLCIGAVDAEKYIAPFSSFGPSADLRTKPDVVAQGSGTAIIFADGTVGFGSGTSYSCPLMAGMVACLWQALPDYSNEQIINLIREISDRSSSPNNTYGFGIPNFNEVLFLIDSINYPKTGNNALVKVYPNPFSTHIIFQFYSEAKQEIKITLVNAIGVEVFSATKEVNPASYSNIEMDNLPNFERGYYFLTVYSNSGKQTQKMVKF